MVSEFEFLQKLREQWRRNHRSVRLGIGDDAAILAQNTRHETVITADMMAEDVDFRLDWMPPFYLGRRALSVSLSDLAAMGAKPVWSMTSIALPKALWQTSFLDEFYEGWHSIAKKINLSLIGGDISRAPDKVVIDAVLGGVVRRNRAVRRSGAKRGDLIYVTGSLGAAASGLRLLENGARAFAKDDSTPTNALIKAHIDPVARCRAGFTLGSQKIATAMIDISDGLSSDLHHLCRESNVGARIDWGKVPVNPEIIASNQFNETEISEMVLHGGEDFELLFTVPPRLRKHLRESLAKLNVTCIGEITAASEGVKLFLNGQLVALPPGGFRHF